ARRARPPRPRASAGPPRRGGGGGGGGGARPPPPRRRRGPRGGYAPATRDAQRYGSRKCPGRRAFIVIVPALPRDGRRTDGGANVRGQTVLTVGRHGHFGVNHVTAAGIHVRNAERAAAAHDAAD